AVGAIGGVSSSMGVFGLSVLVVVIVGGLDSVLGALLAGLLIGVLEALAGAFLGGEFKLLVTFLVLVAVLMVRPYGLFGTREIERLWTCVLQPPRKAIARTKPCSTPAHSAYGCASLRSPSFFTPSWRMIIGSTWLAWWPSMWPARPVSTF